MTTVTRFINTNSSPGGDGTTNGTAGATRAYASMSEWESAEQTDLVTDGDVHVVNCDGAGGADTTAVTIAGWTTGASNTITIQGNSGSRHGGSYGGGYKISQSATFTKTIDVQVGYVTIEGIEIQSTGNNNDYCVDLSGTNNVLANCLLSGSAGWGVICEGSSGEVRNCVIKDCTNGIDVISFASASWWNVGVANATTGFRSGTFNGAEVRNCWSFNNTTSYTTSGSWQGSSGNNATDETVTTNCPGSSNQANLASGDFVDTTDFVTDASGTVLVDNGADLSGSFTDTIDDGTRSGTWDIGPYAVAAAGGGKPMLYYQQMTQAAGGM